MEEQWVDGEGVDGNWEEGPEGEEGRETVIGL